MNDLPHVTMFVGCSTLTNDDATEKLMQIVEAAGFSTRRIDAHNISVCLCGAELEAEKKNSN